MSQPQQLADKVPHAERLLLDTQSAAEMLSISPNTLEKLPIPRRRIPGVKRTLWRLDDLKEYVRSLSESNP